MEVSTVYLTGKYAPKESDHLSGYVSLAEAGVTVHDRSDYRGTSVFFPMNVVARIEHNSGWR